VHGGTLLAMPLDTERVEDAEVGDGSVDEEKIPSSATGMGLALALALALALGLGLGLGLGLTPKLCSL